MTVDERARAGLFLAMQYPVEVPGVSTANFLRSAATAVRGEAPKLRTWVKEVKQAMTDLDIDPDFAERNVNEGFSGGEKKRHEVLQLALLKPKIAILDETDSGLDVDALRVVSEGVNRYTASGDVGVLLITHYTRILRHITPDVVHVFAGGRIVKSGGPELADELEAEGYVKYTGAAGVRGGGLMTAAGPGGPPAGAVDPAAIRADFPILSRTVRDGRPLVYLDSGATVAAAAAGARRRAGVPGAAQRGRAPRRAPARRGGHRRLRVGARADRGVRRGGPERGGVHQERHRGDQPRRLRVRQRLDPHGAGPGDARFALEPGDEIVVTELEHHANLVPWQELCRRTGAVLRWYRVDDDGRLDLDSLELSARTKVVAFAHQSQRARHRAAGRGAGAAGPRGRGADRARRLPVGAAPAGEPHRAGRRLRGVLRAQDARPVRGGRAVGPRRAARGDAAVPHRRLHDRAGADGGVDLRPAAAAVRGGRADDVAGGRPGAAVDYLDRHRAWTPCSPTSWRSRARRWTGSRRCPACGSSGPTSLESRGGAVSFVVDGVHAHDVGQVLDDRGIAVRVGHHCAWPLHRRFGVAATVRATFAVYNTPDEVAALVDGVRAAREFFGVS